MRNKQHKRLGFTLVVPYEDNEGFIGKVYDREGGQIVSQKQHHISAYYCIYKEYKNMREIHDEYIELYSQNNFALILGKPKHVEVNEGFLLFSEARLRTEFNYKNKSDYFEYDGMKCFARTAENFEPVNLILFDYDCDNSTPIEHRFETHGELTAAINTIIPNFDLCSHIITESSSSGIVHEDNSDQLLKSRKWHILVEVDDPYDTPRFSKAFMQNAWKQGMAWEKRSKSNSRLDRSIIDRSTLSPSRLVYEGRPLLKNGLKQAIHMPILNEGKQLYTSSVSTLDYIGVSRVSKANGLKKEKVFNTKTGEGESRYTLNFDNMCLPILKNSTTFFKAGNRDVLLTVRDFINSGDDEWRIISEFRCSTLEEMRAKGRASEAIYLQGNGEIVIHEYDGNIRYIKANKLFITPKSKYLWLGPTRHFDPLDEYAELDYNAEDDKTYKGNEIDLLGNLKSSERHLVFGIAGQGKSRQCLALAKEGYAVIFACATNKQAEEQYQGFTGKKALALSKRHHLKRDHDVEIVQIRSDSPWDAPATHSEDTIKKIMERYPCIDQEEARAIYDDCGDTEAPIEKGAVLFTTLDRVKIMGLKGQLVAKQKNGVLFSTLKKLVVIVDDVEYDKVSNCTKVTNPIRRWLLEELKSGIKHDVTMHKKVEFVLRKDKYKLDHALRGVRTVFTTVEKHTMSQLKRVHGVNIMIHDMTNPHGEKHPQSNLYVFGTNLVRKRYHHLIPKLVDKWRTLADDMLFIADGVPADENHYCVRGSNSYEKTTIIVKISQPHLHKVFQIEVDHGDADYSTRDIVLEVILSAAEQSIGRNQGMRHHGYICIVLVDGHFMDGLVANSSVKITWVGTADKDALTSIVAGLPAQVAKDLCDPLAALGLEDYDPPQNSATELEEAILQVQSDNQKQIDKEDKLLDLISHSLFHSTFSIGLILRRHNAYRVFDKSQINEIKSYCQIERLRSTAIDYFIEGRRREFERSHNLSRLLPDSHHRIEFWESIEDDISRMN